MRIAKAEHVEGADKLLRLTLDLGGETCLSQGFSGGPLVCAPGCTALAPHCGDGLVVSRAHRIVVLLADQLLGQHPFRPLQLALLLGQLQLGATQFHLLTVVLQLGQDLVLLHPVALLHVQQGLQQVEAPRIARRAASCIEIPSARARA